jgi:hypothetical protein
MSHPKRRPDHDYLAGDYPSYDDDRPFKRQSPNPTSQQHPSLGRNTYTHRQPSSQHLKAPQTIDFGQRSFDFCPPDGSNQASPHPDAWSNLPPQNYYQNLAGNAVIPPSDDGNSFYPVGTSGFIMHNSGEPPLQSPFDWTAPVIGHTQFGNPYDDVHRASNEANWSALGSPAPANFINPAPSQPTYGISPAPLPIYDTYYPPMNNALGGTFANEEIEAAYGCTLPAQTKNCNDLPYRSAVSSGTGQDTARPNNTPCSNAAMTPVSLVLSNTVQSGRKEIDTSPAWSDIPPGFLTAQKPQVALGPTYDKELKPGDNCPPRKLNNPIVDSPQDLLSLALRTDFSPDSMSFLEPRPDPGDVSKIPTGQSGCLIMGVFRGILSMSYVHPASSAKLSAGQKLENCSAADDFMEQRLSKHGNEIISLIQNSYRWTTLLPRSTVKESNGIVTLSKQNPDSRLTPRNRYTNGDIQKASLCVAAAAISTYILSCRPVFDQATYDRIRMGAQELRAKPGTALPSGVNNLSHDELNKIFQVPPDWGNRKLPLVKIAGQWVGDGPELMNVDSG